jgi:hypothetical protein
MSNRLLPSECVHVRDGTMETIETITLETIGQPDDDYRYSKGPDSMKLCPLCAGFLMAKLGELVEASVKEPFPPCPACGAQLVWKGSQVFGCWACERCSYENRKGRVRRTIEQ